MDYWPFVRQHRELDLPDFESELDFAASQLAWKKVFDYSPLDNSKHYSASKRLILSISWREETKSLRANFDKAPARIPVSVTGEDAIYREARDTYLQKGFEERAVDQALESVLSNRDTQIWELRDDLSKSINKEIGQERDRLMIKSLIEINRAHKERGTSPSGDRIYDEDGALDRLRVAAAEQAEKSVLEQQKFKLDDFSPTMQRVLVIDWTREIALRNLDLLLPDWKQHEKGDLASALAVIVGEKVQDWQETEEQNKQLRQALPENPQTEGENRVQARETAGESYLSSRGRGVFDEAHVDDIELAYDCDCDLIYGFEVDYRYDFDDEYDQLLEEIEQTNHLDFSPPQHDVNRLLFDPISVAMSAGDRVVALENQTTHDDGRRAEKDGLTSERNESRERER